MSSTPRSESVPGVLYASWTRTTSRTERLAAGVVRTEPGPAKSAPAGLIKICQILDAVVDGEVGLGRERSIEAAHV